MANIRYHVWVDLHNHSVRVFGPGGLISDDTHANNSDARFAACEFAKAHPGEVLIRYC